MVTDNRFFVGEGCLLGNGCNEKTTRWGAMRKNIVNKEDQPHRYTSAAMGGSGLARFFVQVRSRTVQAHGGCLPCAVRGGVEGGAQRLDVIKG